MVKGWFPISVSEHLGQRLATLFTKDRKRPENQKFSPWVNNILLKYVEFQEQQKEHGPFLEFKDADENMVTLYDHEKRKSLTVYIDVKKKKLQCEYHNNKTDCLHVGFCYAIPEVYLMLINNGFKDSSRHEKVTSTR
jgi:hypothetical protein